MTNVEKLAKVFADTFGISEAETKGLQYQGIEAWDSVGHMTLIAALEDEFDIMLEPEDMMSFTSYEQGKEILSKAYNVQF